MDELLQRGKNVRLERGHLPLGDYVLSGGRVICERKTVSDFETSITGEDKRLFNQAERIALEPGTLGVILIEGDLFGSARQMRPEQICGALSYLAIIKGLSVLHTLDAVHTAYTLVKMATHVQDGLGYQLALRSTKPRDMLSASRFVLEGLPGISGQLADRLLTRFGSLAGVMNATLGEVTAARVIAVIHERTG